MTDIKLRKVEQVRLFEQAVEQISDIILSGNFAPEEKLPSEQELSKQLNVSRSSVREALRVLEADGLIEVRRGAGIFVAAKPYKGSLRSEFVHWLAKRKESLEQLLQVRESIEGLTASLVAVTHSKDLIEQLRLILHQQKSLLNPEFENGDEIIDKLAALDAEFHLTIAEASGNVIAYEIISHIFPAYNQGNKAVIYVGNRQYKMVNEHTLVFNAIETGDPVAAEKFMRDHIARVRSEVELQSDNDNS